MGTGGTSIASLYATIGADTTGFQNGLGSAKSALSTFGTSLAGQLVSVASVTTAIAGLGKLVSSSVTDWADYADSMRIRRHGRRHDGGDEQAGSSRGRF